MTDDNKNENVNNNPPPRLQRNAQQQTVLTDAEELKRFNRMLVAMNGDLFVANDAGEADEFTKKNAVYFPHKWKADQKEGEVYAVPQDLMIHFLGYNWHHLGGVIQDDGLRAKVVYLRFLAARQGLMHPNFQRAQHRVRYNEAIFVSQEDIDNVDPVAEYNAMSKAYDALSDGVKMGLQKQFSNLVAIVGIMFRARGHHYLAEMEERYESLWAKNRNAPVDLIKKNEWVHIATTAFHAIFPDMLDDVLVKYATNGSICNPFILRHDGPCAGTAVWFATYAGVANVQTVAGTKNKLLLDQIAILNNVMRVLKQNRWAGGINKNFYGAQALDVDVKSIQELVAAVRGMVEPQEVQSTLKDSKALTRTAKQSPIVGAIWTALSSAILEAANSAEIRRPLGIKALTSVGFGEEATVTAGRLT